MSTYAGNDVFPQSVTLPDDAAPPDGANVNPALEGDLDRTRWLYNRTGAQRLIGEGAFTVADSGDTGAVCTVGGNPASFSTSGYTNAYANTLVTIAAGFGFQINDIVKMRLSGNVAKINATDPCWTKLIVNDGGLLDVVGTNKTLGDIGNTHAIPCTIAGRYLLAHAGGSLKIAIDGRVTNTGAGQLLVWMGAMSFDYEIWRVNP